MFFLLSATAVFLASALVSFLLRNGENKRKWACGGMTAGSLPGLVGAFQVLAAGSSYEMRWFSGIPGVDLAAGVDPLSAFFLAAVFLLSLLSGVYAWGYFRREPKLAGSLPFFPVLAASMVAVLMARDGLTFLVCWEIMSLSSFFLVVAEHESKEVRFAGWVYLVAMHLAAAFLMLFFVLLSQTARSFLFADFVLASPLPASLAGVLFLLALAGFGTKAGLFPLHVWLPQAHPAAPSPVSALMSGVMIKTGIYGLARTLTFLGEPQVWWGGVLIILGIVSAVLGLLHALMRQDVKRLLAYSSIENIGIIAAGLGLGILGIAWKNAPVALIGFAGAFFHVWNHALFKGLLFMGAGSVVQAVHTRLIESMGGLIKKMPATGAVFLVGAASACGLPVFCGFVSEWLVYIGFLKASLAFHHFSLFLSVAGAVALAFAGGLAVAAFTKTAGVVFLGEPRSEAARHAAESPLSMRLPMIVLAVFCLLIGCFPQSVWFFVATVVVPMVPAAASSDLHGIFSTLNGISLLLLATLLLFGAVYFVRSRMAAKKPVSFSETWGCGYASVNSRMQYTGASFAEPIGVFFRAFLAPVVRFKKPEGCFPEQGSFGEHYEDPAQQRFYLPVFEKVGGLLARIRKCQRSRTQDYLALIFFTLIALLLWEVWFGI